MDIITNEYTITKKIAKHGSRGAILIPKDLQEHLPHQTLVEIRIKVLERPI